MRLELIVHCTNMDYLPACLVGIDMQDHKDYNVVVVPKNPDKETLEFVETFCDTKDWDCSTTGTGEFSVEQWIELVKPDGIVFLGNNQRFTSEDALTRIDRMLEQYGSITGDITALTLDEYYSQELLPIAVPIGTFLHRYDND